jgi:hypothetical protein
MAQISPLCFALVALFSFAWCGGIAAIYAYCMGVPSRRIRATMRRASRR